MSNTDGEEGILSPGSKVGLSVLAVIVASVVLSVVIKAALSVVPGIGRFSLGFKELAVIVSVNGTVLYFAQQVFERWTTEAIKNRFAKDMENYKETLKEMAQSRDQAARIAELLALYFSRDKTINKEETIKALNQLAWEISLYAPADILRDLKQSLEVIEGDPQSAVSKGGQSQKDPREVLISIRRLLLGPSDALDRDAILHFRIRDSTSSVGAIRGNQ